MFSRLLIYLHARTSSPLAVQLGYYMAGQQRTHKRSTHHSRNGKEKLELCTHVTQLWCFDGSLGGVVRLVIRCCYKRKQPTRRDLTCVQCAENWKATRVKYLAESYNSLRFGFTRVLAVWIAHRLPQETFLQTRIQVFLLLGYRLFFTFA